MGYLAHLKRQPHCEECRWIVKYDTKELIREVKLVYKPSEYSKANAKRYGNKARRLYKRDEVVSLLELDKDKRSG